MVYVTQIIMSLILIIILNFNHNNYKIKNKRSLFILFSFLPCFIIMAFRDISVGVDTQMYASYYSMVSHIPWSDLLRFNMSLGMESGYTLFMKLCSTISDDYYFFQVIYSIIFCYLSAKFIDRFSNNELIVFICYLGMGIYTAAFNLQRQMLAVMILANGFWYVVNNRKIVATVMCLLALSIHQTSIIFLGAFIIYFLRYEDKLIKLIPILLLFVVMNYDAVIEVAMTYFPYYQNYYKNFKTIQSAGGVWIIWILILCIAIAQVLSKVKEKSMNKENNADINIYAIMSLIYVSCNIIGLYFNYFERLGQYFIPFVPLLLDRFSSRFTRNVGIAYKVGIFVAFSAYYLLSCFTGRALLYSFFW